MTKAERGTLSVNTNKMLCSGICFLVIDSQQIFEQSCGKVRSVFQKDNFDLHKQGKVKQDVKCSEGILLIYL
jgi:hypothetical protein